ncbi:MAG: PGF-pre-PGF domain-containing protein [Methanocorpusculum sp.]|nr:PGF-pre-PGF domain-containing protein [Methanocorpusculum sp.]
MYEPELMRIEIGGDESLSVGTFSNLFVDLYDQNDNIIISTSDYSILWNIEPTGILEIKNVFPHNAEVFALKEGGVEVTVSCNGITSAPYQVTVGPLEITNMDIVIGRDSCPLGSPINFQAKTLSNGNPVSAPSEKVAWVITDAFGSTIKSGQASFSEIVEYTPKELGTYTVKLTYNTLTAEETIEVYEATPSYVLYMESQTLEVGTEQMYHFFVCDQHEYPIDDEVIIADLSWEITSGSEFAEIEVSEFNYFTLTSTGKLGSVTLIPKYNDDELPIILEGGGESVSLTIKVFNPANVGKITINEFSIPSIIETDSSSLIRTTSYDTNGYCLVNPELTWTVDNPEILKFVNPGSESPGLVDSIAVKSEGEMFIHALSPGTATITISSGTVSVSLNIKVYAPEPTSIKTIQSSSSFAVGETTLITVEVYDQMDSFCSEAEVRYQVDNTIVDVSYDEDLKILSITPKKTGSTTLKIFSGRASTSIPITVLEDPSLTITCDDAVIYGFTQTTIRGVANVHTVYLYVQTGSGEYCEFEDVNSHGISVSNGKWEYSFTPSEEFIHTNQIIRVTGERYNVLDGTVTQPSLNSDIPYAEIKLNIEYPGVVIIETEKSSDKIGVIGTAVGAETLQYYLFDAEGIRTGTIPVNPSEYTYSLEIDRSEIHGWECYLLLQHPYTDNLFNLKLDGTTLSIYDTEESGLASEASNSLSLDNKYGKEAYDIVVDFIDHELDAYDYSWFNFVNPPEISPVEGVYELPLTITLTTDIVGAKIYYTIDGERFSEYFSPLVISEVTEEFTIGAVTVVDDVMSNVKYAVFSITEDTSSSTSSSKNTGSGNYNEYPRTVTNGGEVSFGTSKIVKSVDLPKGLSGEVKLIAKSETPGPEGKETYNVFEINIPNYPKGEKAVIRFTISAAELEAKGFGPADIRLYHYDEENGWTPLSTSYKVTGDGVSYEAETSSFSPFAIVFEKGAATERADAEVPEDIPGVTPGDDEPLPSIPDTPTETPQTPSPVFGVIAGLLGAGLLLRRK